MLIPRISKSKDIGYFKKATILNISIVFPVLVIMFLFSDELLKLFFGINSYDASLSLKILSVSALFMSLYTICASSLQGLGHAKIPVYVLSFGILLNASLNYILIYKLGIIGGAIATLVITSYSIHYTKLYDYSIFF